VQIGIRLSEHQGDWPSVRTLALFADQAGFDSIWVADHLLAMPDNSKPFLEGWTLLTAVGSLTKTAKVGMVLNQSFRAPGLLAKMTTTLDIITDGRLKMILGAGYHEPEYKAYGFPFPPVGERMELLEEAIQVLRGLWATGDTPFSFNGIHVNIQDAINTPAPNRRIEFAVGGGGPRVMKLAARYADEWSCPSDRMGEYRALAARMDDLTATEGRCVRRMMSMAFRFDVDALGPSELGGSEDQIVDRLSELAELGATDVNAGVKDMRSLERVAAMLPALRSVK
jgi:alkanesulfonate monooxygenase SsuD/methylene tetrahydromethanopterin reductase-like flavin-dependent oxidoreductase (luciferase family)